MEDLLRGRTLEEQVPTLERGPDGMPVRGNRTISTQVPQPNLAALADFFTAIGSSPELAGRQSQNRLVNVQSNLDRQRSLARESSALSLEEMEQVRTARREQRADIGTLADLISRGGESQDVEFGGRNLRILGQKDRAQLEAEAARNLAKQRTLGAGEANIELGGKVKQQEVEDAKELLSTVGISEEDPNYNRILGSLLDIPEFADVDIGGQKITLPAKDAANVLARIQAAKIAGQTRVTVAGIGKGAGGKGGLTPAQEIALSDMLVLEKNFTDIESLYKGAKSKIGFLGGGGRELARSVGITVDKSFNALAVSVSRMRNKLLKIRSGSAVTDNELRRIAQELPSVTDSAQDFSIKLEQGLADLRSAIQIFKETAGGGTPMSTIVVTQDDFDKLPP